MPTTFNEAIPLFFHLASNAFTDMGWSVGLKKKTKKRIHKKSRRSWYPRVMLKVNIHIFGLTKCTIKTVKNAPVFVPVFLYAVTMLIFQTKRIISNEKWFNYVDSLLFSFLMPKIWVGQTTLNGEKKGGLCVMIKNIKE